MIPSAFKFCRRMELYTICLPFHPRMHFIVPTHKPVGPHARARTHTHTLPLETNKELAVQFFFNFVGRGETESTWYIGR
jgi:hypothetical protein